VRKSCVLERWRSEARCWLRFDSSQSHRLLNEKGLQNHRRAGKCANMELPRYPMLLLIAASLLALASCADPEISRIQTINRSAVVREIQVLSDPPGAKINVNGDYVGNAPITVHVECTPYGLTLNNAPVTAGLVLNNTEITAEPFQNGQYEQRRDFGGYVRGLGWLDITPVPSRILFVMALPPPITRGMVTPQVDVNLHTWPY